jgi:hypothetical protein
MSHTQKYRAHQSYTSKQIRKHAESNFNSRAGTLVRKDDGNFSTLVSNCASDLCRRLALRDRIKGNVKRITSSYANLLHDTLVPVIEHRVRAESLDEVEILGRGRCHDAESAQLCELDGILAEGRRATPNENGALRLLGSRPSLEGRRQLETLMQALQGG